MAELNQAGIAHEAEIFGGTRHTFTVWGTDDDVPEADAQSESGWLEILEAQLQVPRRPIKRRAEKSFPPAGRHG